MKINARLLLLTFTIVVIVTVSSSIVYFSLTNKIITTQENQRIHKSRPKTSKRRQSQSGGLLRK